MLPKWASIHIENLPDVSMIWLPRYLNLPQVISETWHKSWTSDWSLIINSFLFKISVTLISYVSNVYFYINRGSESRWWQVENSRGARCNRRWITFPGYTEVEWDISVLRINYLCENRPYSSTLCRRVSQNTYRYLNFDLIFKMLDNHNNVFRIL